MTTSAVPVQTFVLLSELSACEMTPAEIVTSARARRLHLVDGALQDLEPGSVVRCRNLARVASDALVIEAVHPSGRCAGGRHAGVIYSPAIWGALLQR